LVVALHLQPTGRLEAIETSIGFFFSDDPPDSTPLLLRLGRQNIDIAAGEKDYSVSDSYTVPVDVRVLALKPHAHYRAHEIKAMAILPDGTTKWLLYIKDWDFRWQHVYRYITPIVLRKGTTLRVQYTYDNSAENPRNPQLPPRRVRWGPRSVDEMGDLWLQVLAGNDRDRMLLAQDFRPKWVTEDVAGYDVLLETEPRNSALHDEAALLDLELGRVTDAIAHFGASLRAKPASAIAHFNLGTSLMFGGRLSEAAIQFQEALRLQPDYAAAHDNLGSVLSSQGKLGAAIAQYREAVRLQPENARARNNLGNALMTRGNLSEADLQVREAIRVDPRLPDARYNLGLLLASRGEQAEAVQAFREALELRPDWSPVLTDLAWVLATAPDGTRDADESILLARRSVQLTQFRDARALDVLGAAYAAADQFEEALATVQQAIDLNPVAPNVSAMRQRRALYEHRVGYVEHK
jgi:tetratricopeptide (TPR) repeat protein